MHGRLLTFLRIAVITLCKLNDSFSPYVLSGVGGLNCGCVVQYQVHSYLK
jgi:hypothetical protein